MKQLFGLAEITIGAITDPSLWTDLTNEIVECYSLRSASIFASPVTRNEFPAPYFSDFFRKDGRDILEYFLGGGDESDRAVYERVTHVPEYILRTEEDLMGVSSHRELMFCKERELMRDVGGIQSRLTGVLNGISPWRDIVALHSIDHSIDVPERVFSEMNLLLPVIGKAMNTHRALETLKRVFNAKLGALDHLEFGAVLVSQSGAVLYGNSYFKELAGDGDGLSILPKGEIGFLDQETAAIFTRLVQTACAPHRNMQTRSSLTLSIPRRSRKMPYFIKAHALTDGDRETDVRDDFALLFVIDPTRAGSLSDSGILDLGLLTKSESEVCAYLLSGESTRRISTLRDVSMNTTRQQIKAVLAKLRCRDRLHLYQVAFTTHLPIRKLSQTKDGKNIARRNDEPPSDISNVGRTVS